MICFYFGASSLPVRAALPVRGIKPGGTWLVLAGKSHCRVPAQPDAWRFYCIDPQSIPYDRKESGQIPIMDSQQRQGAQRSSSSYRAIFRQNTGSRYFRLEQCGAEMTRLAEICTPARYTLRCFLKVFRQHAGSGQQNAHAAAFC
jgi:hypothetical protein